MENKRPISREKRVTDNSKGVNRRGNGLGTGPVGGGKLPGGSANSSGSRGNGGSGAGRNPIFVIIAILIALLGGGGAVSSTMFGSDGDYTYTSDNNYPTDSSSPTGSSYSTGDTYYGGVSDTNEQLDYSVAEGSRAKYTKIIGNGEDTITLMVYMCGTDLESRSGMATNDISEMLKANLSDKVNLIIYTGGCKQWKNNMVSSSTNQIYQVKDHKLVCLERDLGSVSMTKPSTLSGFIEYCHGNFPANRYDLILWDHGGGSVSGYGYDEKYASSGSMRLSGIKKALGDANVDFDFIGFDACLMATLENGLMLADYADYMIASEETEPGVGWYYTNWLTELSNNTSLSTVEIGKSIINDFVSVCSRDARGQKTTLSIVDLAELSNTVPDKFKAFSASTSDLIKNEQYQKVAVARSSAREFSTNSKIDQIDLINLAENLGTEDSLALAKVLRNAVKYNYTSMNMTDANGISIYFPYRKLSYVDTAVQTYSQIGLDEEYSKCIKEYAGLETTGQVVSHNNYGESYSSLFSLLGATGNSSSLPSGYESVSSDALAGLMSSLFLSDRSLSEIESESYVEKHSFDASQLVWSTDGSGNSIISLAQDQWDLITDIELNMFVDDGSGFIDMGLDNLFDFNEKGDLIAQREKTWIAINGQPVAYYHMSSVDTETGYSITGYVPALVDGQRVKIILEFDESNPYGIIAGVNTDYLDSEVDVQAKNLEKLDEGSTIEFICDYYSYDGQYLDSFFLGEAMEVTDTMEISNVNIGDKEAIITYCFTDIFNNTYWSESLTNQ